MLLFFGVLWAAAAMYHGQFWGAFLAFIASVVLILATSLIVCCNKTDETTVQKTFLCLVICVVCTQFLAILIVFGTVGSTAEWICSNGQYECYSVPVYNSQTNLYDKCGCLDEDWCDEYSISCHPQNASVVHPYSGGAGGGGTRRRRHGRRPTGGTQTASLYCGSLYTIQPAVTEDMKAEHRDDADKGE